MDRLKELCDQFQHGKIDLDEWRKLFAAAILSDQIVTDFDAIEFAISILEMED